MDWIEIDGAGLRYDLIEGGTTTLVLVHEMGATLESWDLVLPQLEGSPTVLRYDTRGAGLSSKIRGTGDIDRMADDIAALLDHCGRREPVVIAGGAVGGGIALHFAARHVGRVRGVVALGPATGVPADRRAAVLAHADEVEQIGMAAVADEQLARSYPEVMRGDAARFARFRARWLGNDPSSYAAIYRMLASNDLADEIAGLEVPVLFLAGRHDPLRPRAVVEPLAREITAMLPVPTIGIGASPACDGQILVLEDMLGLSARVPKFVRRFGNLSDGIRAAVEAYAAAVRDRSFPAEDNVYLPKGGTALPKE